MVICDDDSGRGAQNWASLHFYRNFFDNLYINILICITKYIEMRKEYLGEFEELVLTIVAVLQDDAYGIPIFNEIKEPFGRNVNPRSVIITIYRLEDKGYLKSHMGGATSERGGRLKRIFTITHAGPAVLRTMKEARMNLCKLIPQLKFVG